jgi:hypothetical protein
MQMFTRAVGRGRVSPRKTVQTAANLSQRLADVLHGAFVGTIDLTAEAGIVVRWEIDETFKSGRVADQRPPARDPNRFASELAALLAGRFTGRIRLHCNDGAVIRYARQSTLNGAHGDLLTE